MNDNIMMCVLLLLLTTFLIEIVVELVCDIIKMLYYVSDSEPLTVSSVSEEES